MTKGPIYLSLGSNLGARQKNLQEALERLRDQGTLLIKQSSIYETEPVEVTGHPDFLNQACEVKTRLHPKEFLQICQKIETRMGRVRKKPGKPRIIDIDILFYEKEILMSSGLKIPHPALYKRNFVLIPLEEIAPDFQDPVTGKTVSQLREECPDRGRVCIYANL